MMSSERNRKPRPKSRRLLMQRSLLSVNARKRGKGEQLSRPLTQQTTKRKVKKVNSKIRNLP